MYTGIGAAASVLSVCYLVVEVDEGEEVVGRIRDVADHGKRSHGAVLVDTHRTHTRACSTSRSTT